MCGKAVPRVHHAFMPTSPRRHARSTLAQSLRQARVGLPRLRGSSEHKVEGVRLEQVAHDPSPRVL